MSIAFIAELYDKSATYLRLELGTEIPSLTHIALLRLNSVSCLSLLSKFGVHYKQYEQEITSIRSMYNPVGIIRILAVALLEACPE